MATGHGAMGAPASVSNKGKAPLVQPSEALNQEGGPSGAPSTAQNQPPVIPVVAQPLSALSGQIPAANGNPRSNCSRGSTWQHRERGNGQQTRTRQQAPPVRRPDHLAADTSIGNGKFPPLTSNFIRYPPASARHVELPHVMPNSNFAAQHHSGQPIIDCQVAGQSINGLHRDNWNGLAPMEFGHVVPQALYFNQACQNFFEPTYMAGQWSNMCDVLPKDYFIPAGHVGGQVANGSHGATYFQQPMAASHGGSQQFKEGDTDGWVGQSFDRQHVANPNYPEPSDNATAHLPNRNPTVNDQSAGKSFAAAVASSAPFSHLHINGEFTADPSPYPQLALGQIAGDVTKGGFVRSHALDAGEFGLLPNLNINPNKSVVDGKPVLELSDEDVAHAEDFFINTAVIKFWGTRPPLEMVHADVVKNWGVMGRFVMGLRDQKTLLIRFELESNLLMALSRDSNTIKDSSFKVFRWKHVADGSYDAVITPVWVALPKLPEHC